MEYEDADIPLLGLKGSQTKYRTSDKGKTVRLRQQRDRKNRRAMERPFLAWDGEGVTDTDGTHRYTLLANSAGEHIVDHSGLKAIQIYDFILSAAERYPNHIHIIYGGGYDFNMWFYTYPNMSKGLLTSLYTSRDRTPARLGKYSFVWRQGKCLDIKTEETRVRIYDVVSFFQCSFVAACDKYLGDKFEDRERIVANKAKRGEFTDESIEETIAYNAAELRNLVHLMEELRTRLNNVGMRPSRWDGPGAVASRLMQKEGVKDSLGYGLGRKNAVEEIEESAKAARIAYAGGRFELVRYGDVDGPAYEYDINSAYPAALRHVPCLTHGQWIHYQGDAGSRRFAVYHVRACYKDEATPGPLFRRHANGIVDYPAGFNLQGWYWSPEIDMLREWRDAGLGEFVVLETWEWVPEECDNPKPFSFIDALYAKRQTLKKAGDGAHEGIKLGLNSLYGKLAQQVGYDPIDKKIPPYHQLEWAGFTTSHCRATVYRAAMQKLDSVIAFETDALFTSEPLQLPIGSGLGEWEETRFKHLAYVSSGFYFGTTEDDKCIEKTRGVDRGTVNLQIARDAMATDGIMRAQLTRFNGAGIGLMQGMVKKWCRWTTEPKNVKAYPTGKRVHNECPECDDRKTSTNGGATRRGVWHTTYNGYLHFFPSHEFPIAWVNPNEDMDELEERREYYMEELSYVD